MAAHSSLRSILTWRPRPMTIALLRSCSFRLSGVIAIHHGIVNGLQAPMLIVLLWTFTGLAIFVSIALSYQAARLERQQARCQLLSKAGAYIDECERSATGD
jgi:hypothetical protein